MKLRAIVKGGLPMLSVAGGILWATMFASVQHGAHQHGQAGGDALLKVEQLFNDRCISCHLPPDPQFAVDRAWLEQIKLTA